MNVAHPVHVHGGMGTASRAPRRSRTIRSGLVLLTMWACTTSAADTEPPTQTSALPTTVVLDLVRSDLAAGRRELARKNLLLLLDRQPGQPEAVALLAALDHPQPSTTPSGAVAGGDELAREARLADGRRLFSEAQDAVSRQRLDAALALLERAEAALGEGLGEPVVDDLRQRIVTYATLVRREIAQRHGPNRDGARREAERVRARLLRQEQQTLSERLHRIELLEGRQLLQTALADCRDLLHDHPESAAVRALFQRLLDASHEQLALDLGERRHELYQEIHEQIARSMIPRASDDGVLFPKDWAERHPAQDHLLARPQTVTDEDRIVRERLLQRTTLNTDQGNAVELLRALARAHHINVIIAPEVISADHLVTIKARELTVEHALGWICRLIGTRWSVGNGAIYIGADAEERVVTALYDIGESLFQVRDQHPPWEIGVVPNPDAAAGAGATFGAAVGPDDLPAIAPEDLVDDITQAVSPATWNRPDCSITIRHTSLLVTAPSAVHVLIDELLRARLQQSRLMVGVDARWVTIADSYLEEIGVRWTTTDSLLTLPLPGTSGVRRGTSGFDYSGELINNLPAAAITPAPPTLGTGLSLSSVLIDSLQLSAILTAVERNQRANTVEGSEFVTFNGVRAYCFFGTLLSYIGGYDVAPGAGDGLNATLTPTVTTLRLGAMLNVKPFVSSDRKYVFMEMQSTLAHLQSFGAESISVIRTFPVGFDPDANNGQGGPIVGQVQQNFGIELPNVAYTEVHTYLRIPDGGTILVGGWGRYIEQSMSTKIPFLGHLPFIGRLFGQRGRHSDRHRETLLVTVRVMDYGELEERQ